MDSRTLLEIVEMARKAGHVLVATADARGRPHVAVAGMIAPAPEERLAVSAWFCPGTVANLVENRMISLIVWDRESDCGYQLPGEAEGVRETAILDGYLPGEESLDLPQVERELIVRVEEVLQFSRAPHNDLALA